MLRHLFAEPRRIDQGLILKANAALGEYLAHIQRLERAGEIVGQKVRHWEVWVKGFYAALDELEQSQYCSTRYFQLIKHEYEEEMDTTERDHYHQHSYFYKNAIIRVFSILDKLGFFLNDLLMLQTEKVKSRFSYFTVLRQMHVRKIEVQLEQRLFNLKLTYEKPLDMLRDQRNMEIHSMNYELIDDLLQANHTSAQGWNRIENMQENLAALEKSFDMVCHTLIAIFTTARNRQHA